jgi:hypothetical protein
VPNTDARAKTRQTQRTRNSFSADHSCSVNFFVSALCGSFSSSTGFLTVGAASAGAASVVTGGFTSDVMSVVGSAVAAGAGVGSAVVEPTTGVLSAAGAGVLSTAGAGVFWIADVGVGVGMGSAAGASAAAGATGG